ncbi:MAG: ABC transporter ATP-binding protein [Granulosicoccaceae bacterium]
MSMLQVNGLQAGYGNSQVLFDVSLTVGPGQIVSLLGRNGMGKTTTLNCVMGNITPISGALEFAGQSIVGAKAHLISQAGIALVPEGRQIFPNLSARENLMATQRAPMYPLSSELWTLDRVLTMFPGLEPRLDSPGNLLSGGEQQMLAIGRALLTNPRLLLLDDATEGLAPQVRAEIWQCLAGLKSTKLSIVVVDKNLADMLYVADSHYVIEKGRIVWQGDSAALQSSADVKERYLGI